MILIFGSINADLIVPVPNLPQPGQTVLGGSYSLLPGGKGANQALAACRAGGAVMLAGAIGRDGFAAAALSSLGSDGVDMRLVRDLELPTGCAIIMVSAGGENAIAVAPGANLAVQSGWVPDELLRPDTILVAQLEVPVWETQALIRRARQRGGRCLLNLAPALPIDFELLPDIDLLVANESEAATLPADPPGIAGRLRQALVVTRGAAGASAFLRNGSRLDVPALAIEPVDTTGAGDTFVGVLAASLDLGVSFEAGLRRASAAAGLACLGRGAQTAMPGAAAIDSAVADLAEN
ncbi:MAG: ribokinase [Alphaproteobacteria bacterium]|nr:ribokinase [Alphaproteobacteria bacterium]